MVLGFFLSNFFSRPRTATFSGYLIVVASVVVALLLEILQVGSCDVIVNHVTGRSDVG